jgi:hypothetical protein
MKAIAIGVAAREEHQGRALQLFLIGAAALALFVTPVGAQTTAPATGQPAPAQTAPAQTAPAPSASGTSGAATSQSGASSTSSGTQPTQAAQPGLREINPATLRLTFYTVQPADMLVSNLMGLDVHNLQNEEIGEIEDVIIDNGKMIRSVVIGVGGFLGLGERHVAVEPASVVITREAGGGLKAVVNTTRDDLRNAPEFKFEGNMRRK